VSWKTASTAVAVAFYLGFLAFGIYLDLEDLFGFLGAWFVAIAVHVSVGALLNRPGAALLPFLGVPIAIPASSEGGTPAWILMYFAILGAFLILCGVATRRLLGRLSDRAGRASAKANTRASSA
jgi:hypothetical protein